MLREEWGFEGFVVSDWESIAQLVVHGIAEDGRDATRQAFEAGVDMDMADGLYVDQLPGLVQAGLIDEAALDASVTRVLALKERLGLLDEGSARRVWAAGGAGAGEAGAGGAGARSGAVDALELAYEAALQSTVLLRNEGAALPLEAGTIRRLAVIGPLADEPQEQLGTWVFDGDPELSVTPLEALTERLGSTAEIRYVRGLVTSRSDDLSQVDAVLGAAVGVQVEVEREVCGIPVAERLGHLAASIMPSKPSPRPLAEPAPAPTHRSRLS